MKKRILIVNQAQFGYHIDYVQYSRYLKDDFDVTYLCWDYGWDKIEEPGISIQYINRDGNVLKRNIHFIRAIAKVLKQSHYDFILIHYFRGCAVVPVLFNRKQLISLDIRTGNDSDKFTARVFNNALLYFESLFFKRISIVSESLRKYLKISKTAYILPLGANIMCYKKNIRNRISLIYVGTLTNRRIEDTIIGFEMFLKKNPDADISYTIIGNGWKNELELINKIVEKLNLKNHIFIKGYIPHKDLINYYAQANVGVSWVPVTNYYNYQPATKTFEYLMAGMPVIATSTYENKRIINEQNGFNIDDTPEDFANCISNLQHCISKYDEESIRSTVSEYKWEDIVLRMKNEFINK